MATSTRLDWLHFLGELSLSRTMPQFVAAVEQSALDLQASESRFFLYRFSQNVLVRPGQSEQTRVLEGVVPQNREEVDSPILRRTPVDESSLVGRCALYCEELAEGQERVFPVTRFGSLVGVLKATGGDRELLTELGVLVGLVHEMVKAREEEHSLLSGTLDLLVGATDRMVPEGPGHVERVARLSTKLASMLDLSAQSRQEVWDASFYHDIGCLLLAGQPFDEVLRDHSRVGAEFLVSTGALRHLAPLVAAHHDVYEPGSNTPIEAWVLAMAEDVDRFFSQHRHDDYQENTRAFYAERISRHHPETIDALSGLIDSGKLARLYR